jgi:hypothetical protein
MGTHLVRGAGWRVAELIAFGWAGASGEAAAGAVGTRGQYS